MVFRISNFHILLFAIYLVVPAAVLLTFLLATHSLNGYYLTFILALMISGGLAAKFYPREYIRVEQGKLEIRMRNFSREFEINEIASVREPDELPKIFYSDSILDHLTITLKDATSVKIPPRFRLKETIFQALRHEYQRDWRESH